jgi:Zn-dependent peptidase ImmA (M78 family)
VSLTAVRRKAEALVAAHGIQAAPVPVEEIANRLGLQIVRADLGPDVSGILVWDGPKAYVCVKRTESARRRRFTIGHEIGHFALKHRFDGGSHVHVDRGNLVIQRGPSSSTGLNRVEIEANQFAAALLMPEAFVRAELDALGGEPLTDKKVADLAKRFDVSEQAMTIRLSHLGFV